MVFDPAVCAGFTANGTDMWVLPWVFSLEAIQILFKGLAWVGDGGKGCGSEVAVQVFVLVVIRGKLW